MKKIIGKLFAVGFLMAFLAVGCTSDFEEINTDPDRAKDAPATNVLAYVLTHHANNFYDVWGNMSEPSTYGAHLTKIQYIDEARYQFRSNVVESKWYEGYIELNNLAEIKAKAETDGADNMLGVAKVLEVVIFHTMTDTWRDIPYTDALKMGEGLLLPTYDRQEDIYPALLATLEEANSLLSSGSIDKLGDGDVLFNGDTKLWQKFCNSLRLRLAMRISEVDAALAKSTVETVLGAPVANPIMDSNDDNAFFVFPGSTPYEDTWFEDSKGRDDHAVSDVLVNALTDLNDPRLPVYAKPNEDGVFLGFTIGAMAQPAMGQVSRIGARFRDNAAGFSPFMRYAEVMFHVAEAALKGYNVGSITAQEAYEEAVAASCEENGIPAPAITTYLAGGAAFDGTLEQVYWQEWIAYFKQGMEAWSLFRRTGVPTTHYIAPGTSYVGHNTPPFRYPYPNNESTLNSANSSTFVGEVQDDFWGKQMWWDTRTGVQ